MSSISMTKLIDESGPSIAEELAVDGIVTLTREELENALRDPLAQDEFEQWIQDCEKPDSNCYLCGESFDNAIHRPVALKECFSLCEDLHIVGYECLEKWYWWDCRCPVCKTYVPQTVNNIYGEKDGLLLRVLKSEFDDMMSDNMVPPLFETVQIFDGQGFYAFDNKWTMTATAHIMTIMGNILNRIWLNADQKEDLTMMDDDIKYMFNGVEVDLPPESWTTLTSIANFILEELQNEPRRSFDDFYDPLPGEDEESAPGYATMKMISEVLSPDWFHGSAGSPS